MLELKSIHVCKGGHWRTEEDYESIPSTQTNGIGSHKSPAVFKTRIKYSPDMYRVLGEKTTFLCELLYIFLDGVSLFILFIWFCLCVLVKQSRTYVSYYDFTIMHR